MHLPAPSRILQLIALVLAAGCEPGSELTPGDAAGVDAALAADAGSTDAGATDAAALDRAATDASIADSRSSDSRIPDGATPDSAAPDTASTDHRDFDAGPPPSLLRRDGPRMTMDGQPFQRIAMNKFDLFYQFVGLASGSPVTLTRPQALHAMDDAVAAGVCCFRVAATPFWPVNAETWLNDPATHWAAFDDMLAELNARGLKIIPVVAWHIWLFPDLAGEPFHDLFVPGSAARALLFEYAQELATRYRDDPAILFWELTNEINLAADLDYGSRTDSHIATHMGTPAARSAADNFTSDEMATLVADLATFMKSIDPYHLVSPGYSRPRLSAWHLRSSPEWGGADWTHDDEAEMAQYVALTHPAPIDLVSVHLYPEAAHLGLDGRDPDLIERFQAAADAIDRPLFIGEFGDNDPTVSEHRSANFTRGCMLEMLERRVPLSLIWVWEFYQFAPDAPSAHSIEPGTDDALIAAYSELDGWLDAASSARGADLAVSNAGMEDDVEPDLLVDGWETVWRTGSSADWSARRYANPGDVFMGDAQLRLNSGTGDPSSFVYALSDPIPVSGDQDLVAAAAIRRQLDGQQRMRFSLFEYDVSDSELRVTTLELSDMPGWVFRVEYQRVSLLPATRSVRVRLGAGGGEPTVVDVDQVRLFTIEP